MKIGSISAPDSRYESVSFESQAALGNKGTPCTFLFRHLFSTSHRASRLAYHFAALGYLRNIFPPMGF